MKPFVFRFSISLLAVLAALAGVPSLVSAQDVIPVDPPPETEAPAHIVRSWEVAQVIPAEKIQREEYPSFFFIFFSDWQELEADSRGLVDPVGRTAREDPGGDLVMARHVFYSKEDRVMRLVLGYSDEIDLFFNGQRVFSGQKDRRGRDQSFPGLHDKVPVEVRKGLNEIFLLVTDHLGGWGFMVQADQALSPKLTDHSATEEVWTTPDSFLTPESVLRDPNREILYVTNFDANYRSKPEPSGFVSRLSMEGEILDLRWIDRAHAPHWHGHLA